MKPIGFVYILHFDRPLKHAKHYTGFAHSLKHLLARLHQHEEGKSSVKIMDALKRAGIGFEVANAMQATRSDERRLKREKHIDRHCPICKQLNGKADERDE